VVVDVDVRMSGAFCAVATFGLTLLALAMSLLSPSRDAGAAASTSLAVDMVPAGNASLTAEAAESCVEVSSGSTFDVDIVIRDVSNLLSWEAYFVYDRNVVEILSKNVRMFQAANPGSNLIDASEPLPDDDGRFLIAASETSHAADSGSGVLARLTLRAKAPGVSPANLPLIDVNGNGQPDLGPILTDNKGVKIGDANGDQFFDGSIAHGAVAVDRLCTQSEPTPTPSGGNPTSTPAPTNSTTTTNTNPATNANLNAARLPGTGRFDSRSSIPTGPVELGIGMGALSLGAAMIAHSLLRRHRSEGR